MEVTAWVDRAALPSRSPSLQAVPLESMLRVRLMQNWFALCDPAIEETLYEIASLRTFGNPSLGEAIPDETGIELSPDPLECISIAVSQ